MFFATPAVVSSTDVDTSSAVLRIDPVMPTEDSRIDYTAPEFLAFSTTFYPISPTFYPTSLGSDGLY